MLRRDFLSDIRAIKANKKNLREFAKDKYVNENGEAVIDVFVNESDIYNPFSNPKDRELSEEFISYIDSQTYYIPIDYPIVLNIHSHEEINKSELEEKIKEHYWKKLADKNNDLSRNIITAAILFTIGVVFLALLFVFKKHLPEGSALFDEIFSVVGTFAVWESADYILINRSVLNMEKLNITQSALSKINILKD